MIQIPAGDHFIFMTAGIHASVPLPLIIAQKQQEISSAGYCFWGYGGSLGSPIKPLLRDFLVNAPNQHIFAYMRETASSNNNSSKPATEYSEDGQEWKPIHNAITCTGANYALVFDQLVQVNDKLDLSESVYETAGGIINAGERILQTNQADKARMISRPSSRPSVFTNVVLQARLYQPMQAVILR